MLCLTVIKLFLLIMLLLTVMKLSLAHHVVPDCHQAVPAHHVAPDRLNPYAVEAYDGINLNPLEVVFIKVKGFLLQADWTAPKTSQTYDRWLSHQVSLLHLCLSVSGNLSVAGHQLGPTLRCRGSLYVA